jgi:ribosomal protein S18 acetylase RimI-like enzyme
MALKRSKTPRARSLTARPHTETLFRLRPAEKADYPFMLALYLAGAEEHLSKIGRWDKNRMVRRFRDGFKPDQTQIICAADRDIGFIQIVEFLDRLYLRQLHLIEGFRGRKIGSNLIETLFERAAAFGKPVTLEVLHGNPAKRLYLRLGFSVTGEDPDKEHMIWSPPEK